MKVPPVARMVKALRSWPVQAAVGLIVGLIIVEKWPEISRSFELVKEADINLLIIGTLVFLASYLASSLTYYILSAGKAQYGQLVAVQIATGCTNRLLPSGTGALALNTTYLVSRKVPVATAAAISTTNNILGFVGNGLLLAGSMLMIRFETPTLRAEQLLEITGFVLLGTGAVILCTMLLSSKAFFRPLAHFVAQFTVQLVNFLKSPVVLFQAFGSSMLTTLSYVTCLWVCLMAVGLHVNIAQALLAMSVGVTLGAVVPTPGGIGGVEAGMIAVLSSLGFPFESATAGVLSYRFISFWLPIVPGYVALTILGRKTLIRRSA